MAKRLFPTRSKTKRTRKPFNRATFIQRSRNESSEQKAMFHTVTGAGRSHVRREFFGLTDEEQESAKAKLEAVLAQRVLGLSR